MKSYLPISAAAIVVTLACSLSLMSHGDSDRGLEFDSDRVPWLPHLYPVKDNPPTNYTLASSWPNIDCIVAANDGNAQGETSVAINPTSPNIVLAASNDFRTASSPTSAYIYTSTNGGIAWTNSRIPTVPGNYQQLSDPSLAFDADGDAYYNYGAIGAGDATSAVVVARSAGGTGPWSTPVIAFASSQPSFEDKYIIAADATPTSPFKNRIYVSWTHFVNSGTSSQQNDIYCIASSNKGVTWTSPAHVSTAGNRGHLSMPTVGPSGEVYVVWSEGGNGLTNIMLARSTDGGVSFGIPRIVTGSAVASLPGRLTSTKGDMRMLTYPAAAVDRSTLHRGRVYVTWAALNVVGGSPHVYSTYSDNGGTTWSTPYVVDNELASGHDKFHPWIACDPVSGVVAISYYDGRNDPNNLKTDLYVSYSVNGGVSYSDYRVSTISFNVSPVGASASQGGYWADYTGIAAYRGKIIPCWTDQRNGNSFGNTEVYVAIIGLGPNAVSGLTASVDPSAMQSITLDWTDPTTSLSGDPLTNFAVVIYRDGTFHATVPKGTQRYVDNGLVTGDQHSYQVYVASGADTSAVATASAYAGGALDPQIATILSWRETADGTEIKWRIPTKHTDGTAMYDLNSAYFYVDGARQTVPLQAGDTGKTITRNITAAAGKFHMYSVALATSRLGVQTLGARSDSVQWYAGAPRTVVSETFESTPVIGTNEGWGTVTLGAHGGTHSLCDNNAGRSVKSKNIYAMLAPMLVKASAPQLSFWYVSILATRDSAVAEYSSNHGATWVKISAYPQGTFFTDDVATSTWKNATFDMTPLIGDSVVVRFRLKTSSLPTKQGFFIDDVTMRSPTAVAERSPITPDIPLMIAIAPNPSMGVATITAGDFSVPADVSSTSIKVFDITGREVVDLTSQLRAYGPISARFESSGIPPGMYVAEVRIGKRQGVARFLVQH